MRRSTVLRLSLLATGGVLAAGCASACSTTSTKLAQLRRGMTYDEAARVIGCTGRQVSGASVASGVFATVEWNGPGPALFTDTQADFRDGRLLSFTTGRRYGL
jgi:hypothetical protein